MASSADIQAQIDDLNNKISKLSGGLGGAGQRTTYQAQIQRLQPQLAAAQQAEDQQRQQQEQQAQQQQQEQQQQQAQQLQQQPQQQATPISQVAPQPTTTQFALQGGNASLFSNIDPKTGLPIVKQDAIDAELKRLGTNELTANNSNIRDAIYGSGWNAKSDAVQVLNGAAVYGLAKPINAGIMGAPTYQKPNGAAVEDKDFINAAKAAGIDPNQYMTSSTRYGTTTTAINRDALYNAINDKSKDLYSITNAIDMTDRGDTAPHATILFKADGQGNLVAQNDPTTNQPMVQYGSAVRYNNAPSFMDTFGPFMALLPAAAGVLQYAQVLPSFNSMFGGTKAALDAGQVAANTGINYFPGVEAGAGSVMAGYTGAPLNALGVPAGLGGAGYAGLDTLAGINAANGLNTTALFPSDQINANNPAPMSNANSLSNAVAGTAAGTALANAFANNGLYSALGAGAGALASYAGSQMQADAAKQAAANQMSMFNTVNNQLAPNRAAGYAGLNQIRSMLPGQYTTYGETGQPTGTAQGTDYFTHQFGPQDLQAGLAPNYNFMLGQGQNLNQRQANVSGGALSGNTLQGLEKFTQDYAGNAYQNAFQNYNTQRTGIYNTLAGIAGIGQQATNTSANANQAATTAQGQLGVGSAAAQAAGLQGVANAATGGLQGYQQNQVLQAILAQNQNVAQKPIA